MPLIHLLKKGADTRNYFRIVSNLMDILESAESSRLNIQNRYANFRIYDEKEYICTSFPEIFGQTYDHRYLSGYTY